MQKRSKENSRDRTLERACDTAILNTLRYRAVFKSSLTYYQLTTYLISDRKFEPAFFKRRLQALLRSKKIRVKKGYYYLPDIKPFSWQMRASYSMEHLKNAQPAIKLLKRIKWVKLLAVTGSVAAFNAKKNDDIDLFIITEKERVWLTRFFVVMILKSLNMYLNSTNSKVRFCPNIYVDTTAMEWPPEKRNLYISHDILLMHPYVNRDNTYFKFLDRNIWVFDHFSHLEPQVIKTRTAKKKTNSRLITILEFYAMRFQMWYMRNAKTTELTTRNVIHFNKGDHTEFVLKEFGKLTEGENKI